MEVLFCSCEAQALAMRVAQTHARRRGAVKARGCCSFAQLSSSASDARGAAARQCWSAVALMLKSSSSASDARGAAARKRRPIDIRGDHEAMNTVVIGSLRSGIGRTMVNVHDDGPLSIAVLGSGWRRSMQKSKFGCWPAARRDLPLFWPSEATFLL